MPVYTLTFDASATFSTDQPTLAVWYGGQKLFYSFVQTTSGSFSIDIDTDDTFNHSELRFHFQNNGAEGGRDITVSNIAIGGTSLNTSVFLGSNFTADGTSLTLSQGGFADYDTEVEIPEITDNVTLNGDNNNNVIYGTTHDETINGLDGNDKLYGREGDDIINGGAGDDGLVGDEGNDTLLGGAGRDNLYGRDGNDRLEGGDDNDVLYGDAGDDILLGQGGNDYILAGAGDDIAYGGEGDDFIQGNGGSRDELYGEAGNDKIYGGYGNDRLDGGTGNDIIGSYAGDDNIYGGDGDDILDGGSGSDTVYGDAGSDRIYGREDNDDLRGGTGNDFVYGNTGTDTVYGEDGEDQVYGGNDGDFVYGGADNDFVSGEDGSDRVEGDDGDDVVSGGFGADVVLGEAGNDILYGGGMDGYDIYLLQQIDPTLFFNHQTQSLYKIVSGPVTQAAAQTAAALETVGGVAGSLLTIETALENTFIQTELTNAGETSTWLSASDSATAGTWVWGSGNANGSTFYSGSAAQNNAYTNFAVGEDTGGSGQDHLLFNSSGTWQDEGAATTSAYIIEWNYEDITADTSVDQIFGGIGNDTIFGGGGQDTIKGEDGNDLIYGGTGIDTITGDNGTDVIYGGDGADTINGGADIDTIFGGAGNDRIFFDMTDTIDGGADFDMVQLESFLSGAFDFSNLTSIQHIALDNYQGNAAANTLTMSYSDVYSISDSNTLYITADQGLDIIDITDLDAVNHYIGTTNLNGTIYERYSNGTENLYLEVGLVTANQAFLIDPVTSSDLANDIDINLGSYLAKTTGVAFETGADVTTTQVLYEQGGGTRGLNIYIENGELHMAVWNFAEENWGYREVTTAIAANTRYTASMVMDGVFPANGTLEGFLDGVSIGSVGGVGNLYAHSGGIEIGGNDNTVIGGVSNNNALTFTGTVGKAGQYNAALSGGQLDGFHAFLESGWIIDPLTNNAPDAVDDTATVTSGELSTIDILFNDSDPDGHTISIDSIGSAANGTVVLNGDGTITYQSNLGFSGTDSFTYTITDSLLTDTATVTITVDPAAGGGITDPTEISGLAVWYDTNDAASHIDDGDLELEGINDKTANNLDATQGTAGSKPNVVTINGDSWMEFDGGDSLDIPNSNLINTGGPFNGKSISMSIRTGADVNTRQVIYEQGGGTRGINIFLDGGEIYVNGWNRAETQWGPAFANATVATNTEYVVTMVYDGVAGTLTGYLNGTIMGTVSGLDLLYGHSGGIELGGNDGTYFFTGTGGGNNFTGHIGEVVLYNEAISGADRTALDQYLVDKWVTAPAAPEDTPEPSLYDFEGDDGQNYLYGDAGANTMNGLAGQDYLYGGEGDDTLYFGEGADYLYGEGGADTFTAYETAGQDNDMAFALDFSEADGDKIDISDLLSGYDPVTDAISDFVNIAQGSHTTIQIDRDGSGTAFGWDNVLRLQGNTTLDTDVDQLITDGTLITGVTLSAPPPLPPTPSYDFEGDDGQNYLYGDAGANTMNGLAGQDYLYGGEGDDTLYFGEGADYLYGEGGADTFTAYETAGQDNDMAFALDFSEADGDKIDISDLLSGYDPVTDAISDFVNIAQGSHTTIQIDRDGSGTAFGWDNVLRLQGNTTLDTDVDQLITDGTLLI